MFRLELFDGIGQKSYELIAVFSHPPLHPLLAVVQSSKYCGDKSYKDSENFEYRYSSCAIVANDQQPPQLPRLTTGCMNLVKSADSRPFGKLLAFGCEALANLSG